jgi:predicted CopG family antitoxin
MSADKRIPVTEETREQLHDLKAPGETYDELLQELAQLRRRQDLAERFRAMDEGDREDFVPLADG